MGHQRDYSEELAEKVDAEVRVLIEKAHDEAWTVLNENRDILDKLAQELIEKETLDHIQLADLFTKVKKLPERPLWLSSKGRPLSDRPPIKIAAKAPVDPRYEALQFRNQRALGLLREVKAELEKTNAAPGLLSRIAALLDELK
jgi:hypothetical protein